MKLNKSYSTDPNIIEVGIDESGCGCAAGDLFVSAVILPKDYDNIYINDSKKLSEKKREQLFDEIIKNVLDYSIIRISSETIDEINILNARILGYHKCLDELKLNYNLIAIDGNMFSQYKNKKHVCIVKGDEKYQNIAAASILAKVTRDRYMCKLHEEYPVYNWKNNKGYLTKFHIDTIKLKGITKYHRLTFLKNFNL